MSAFRIPSTGLTVGLDKLKDGYVILDSYPLDEHQKNMLIARKYEVGTTGIFVRPGTVIEEVTRPVTCGRRGCVVPRCAAEEARKISSALTHVFRATGNTVLAVTVPRLANAVEFEAALLAVIDAGWELANYKGVESVYGLVAVPEWHLEGRCVTRANEVIRKGASFFRNSFPYHQHVTVSVELADNAPVEAIEIAFTEALRKRVDESIYRGSLEWKEAAADIAEIKATGLKNSVPVGLLKPLGSLANSDWFKLDYITKNLDARNHALHGGVAGAWGVERQRAICDELLVPGNRKNRVTPLRGVLLSNYTWFNAYAYPQNDVEIRFMSQGNTGWNRKSLEQDVTRRRKGFSFEDPFNDYAPVFYDPSTGWVEEITYCGVTLSAVIPASVIDSDLNVTVAESLRVAREKVRALLMEDCAKMSAAIRTAELKALYAALCASKRVKQQERAERLEKLLYPLVAPLSIKKAAPEPIGGAFITQDVQSVAQKARPPPGSSAARLPILPSIKDIDLVASNSLNGATKAGITQHQAPDFHYLTGGYPGFGVSAVRQKETPNRDWLGVLRSYLSGVTVPLR